MWSKEKIGAACRRLLSRSPTGCDVITPNVTSPTARGCCHLFSCSPAREKCTCTWLSCRSLWAVCTKSYLIITNLTFLLCGIGLTLTGAWMYINHDIVHYSSRLLQDNPVTSPIIVFDKFPIVCLVVGVLLTTISFLGCCGVCVESVCFLSFYSLFTGIIVVTQLICAVLLISFKAHIIKNLRETMRYQLIFEYNKTAESVNRTSLETLRLTQAWDQLQSDWHCCGAVGHQDYQISSWLNSTPAVYGDHVPKSCCITNRADSDSGHVVKERHNLRHKRRQRLARTSAHIGPKNMCQIDAIMFPKSINYSENLYTKGCYIVLTEWIEKQLRNAGFWLTIIVAIQCTGLAFSCTVITWLRKRQVDYGWCEDDDFVE